MYYTRLQVSCDPEFTEILIAEVAEAGFDTFQEIDNGFEAFADQNHFDQELLDSVKERYGHLQRLDFEFSRVEKENWNEQWEKSFEPVIVEDRCVVRAEFHQPEKSYPYEIIITPKMSFGTGHHATTWLMLKAQTEIEHNGKRVMDAGCGTAVLAIMAEKRGAVFIDAFDIDEWSTVNGNENISINGCKNIRLRQGSIRTLSFDANFDIILANINKNILMDEMQEYAACLNPQGLLLLSGFFTSDASDLMDRAKEFGLLFESQFEKEGWCALILKKN
jgi:ribosomal protein L11 methyltransferase